MTSIADTIPTATAVARTLTLFHSPGDTVEIRILGCQRKEWLTAAGYYRDFSKAGEDVARLKVDPMGIYFVMNQVDPALYARAPEKFGIKPKHTTTDRDITRRRWILLDCDPERPAGISSSDHELAAAEKVAADLRDWLTEVQGWPEPAEAMSGNGWHLLFPIDLPNDDQSKQLVERILMAASNEAERMQIADGPKIKIDTAVGNAARITKLYGTMARKGYHTKERPHRRSELVHVPEYLWGDRDE